GRQLPLARNCGCRACPQCTAARGAAGNRCPERRQRLQRRPGAAFLQGLKLMPGAVDPNRGPRPGLLVGRSNSAFPARERRDVTKFLTLPPDTGVMLCGHGSRNTRAVGEFAVLAERLRERLPD